MLKKFADPVYPHSKNGVVSLWHLLKFVYKAHHFILQRLNLFDLRIYSEDGGMSILSHSCGFLGQERVLEAFAGHASFCSVDGIVWIWQLLINCICASPFHPATAQSV